MEGVILEKVIARKLIKITSFVVQLFNVKNDIIASIEIDTVYID